MDMHNIPDLHQFLCVANLSCFEGTPIMSQLPIDLGGPEAKSEWPIVQHTKLALRHLLRIRMNFAERRFIKQVELTGEKERF